LVLVGGVPAELPAADSLAGVGGVTHVAKAADTARTANVALTADPDLVAALGIGTWLVRVRAVFSTANATMDLKFATAFTGTATVGWFVRRFAIAGALSGTDNDTTLAGTGQIASTAVAGTTTGIAYVDLELTITVTVAGTFQFQWAQNTSDAGALTCLRGSWIEYAVT
jgi:hypothetical protein